MHSDNYLKWFDRVGKARPTHLEHIKDEDIAKSMQRLTPHTWRQEGNQLIGEVEGGTRFVQTIPTDRLLVGSDSKGLPVFKKV